MVIQQSLSTRSGQPDRGEARNVNLKHEVPLVIT